MISFDYDGKYNSIDVFGTLSYKPNLSLNYIIYSNGYGSFDKYLGTN